MTSDRPTAYPSAIDDCYRAFGTTPQDDGRASRLTLAVRSARTAWQTASAAEFAATDAYDRDPSPENMVALRDARAALHTADLAWSEASRALREVAS